MPTEPDQLFDDGVLVRSGLPGSFHRSFAFDHVARGLEAYLATAATEPCRRLLFSHVQPAATLERSGYVASFPNLLGAVSTVEALAADAVARDPLAWEHHLSPSGATLCSAGCHALYPLLEGGAIDADGSRFEVQAWCFRHEPSDDVGRLQVFRMHEFVCVGTAPQAVAHRDAWRARMVDLLAGVGLETDVVVASDPFFGRAASLLAEGQRERELKYEIVCEVASPQASAVASANLHEDRMGAAFGLRLADGTTAHSACVGIGLDRIVLALFRRHGTDPGTWPRSVRDALSGSMAPEPWGRAR